MLMVFLMLMVMVILIVFFMLMVFLMITVFFMLMDSRGQIDVDCHADVLTLMLMLRFTVIFIHHDDNISQINDDSFKSDADAGTCSKEGGTQPRNVDDVRSSDFKSPPTLPSTCARSLECLYGLYVYNVIICRATAQQV